MQYVLVVDSMYLCNAICITYPMHDELYIIFCVLCLQLTRAVQSKFNSLSRISTIRVLEVLSKSVLVQRILFEH